MIYEQKTLINWKRVEISVGTRLSGLQTQLEVIFLNIEQKI